MKITFQDEIKQDDQIREAEIVQRILKNREISKPEDFMNPANPSTITLQSFGYDKEIDRALEILKDAKDNEKMIVVYTDYDADGITGGSILWETLFLLGFKVMPYVPHRINEGYGFSIKGIDAVKEQYNPSLIISVDHGIAAREQIKYAKSIGIPIIITDHHHKPELIPEDAEAIFHIPLLSGSGVSYFFSKMVYEYFGKGSKNYELLTSNFSGDYLSLASIGTIADLVPLVGPSRSLVKYGLDAFPTTKRLGIKELIKEAGIEGKKITPYEIGFIIAPRINAIGRLEHAIDALRLLCTTNIERATQLAGQIGMTNKDRQDLVKVAVEEAEKQVEDRLKKGKLPKIIVLVSNKWHEGIIGLISSKISDKYYRPSMVLTKGDGFYKGSARSTPTFHLTDFLTSIKEYFINYGGHKQAAGFSIKEENISKMIKQVEKQAETLIPDSDLERIVQTDLKIPLSKVSMKLVNLIEKLYPFGIGNPKPTFYSEAEVLDAKCMGKKNEHLKIMVKDAGQRSYPIEMVAFSCGDQLSSLSKGKKINVVYDLEINRWNNTERLQGKIKHIS